MIKAPVWRIKPLSVEARRLSDEAGISLLKAQLLVNRGIPDHSGVASFLSPRLADLSDPLLIKDMEAGVREIVRALENRERITVYGDYDADGLTATALLLDFFSDLGVPAWFYIPSRFREGYGLHASAVESIAGMGKGLIITVDCGTSNLKEIESALGLNMRVVVTDHHQVPEDFKPACPVINPHRNDSPFPFRGLAGVGVAFYLAISIRSALRQRGWFKKVREPDLRQYLDLVALGTVADMVPIRGQNRILVKAGLDVMRSGCRPGILALMEAAAVDPGHLTPQDLAFRLAPRLNAPGRMGDASVGVRLLIAEDPEEARTLSREVNRINVSRQSVEQEIFGRIEETMPDIWDPSRRTLVLAGNGWHTGVLGIVASRLVDRYYRPSLVFNLEGGMAKGSGRSIDGFNLYEALCRHKYLFDRFGGHHHAVGLRLEQDRIEQLAEVLEACAGEMLDEQALTPRIDADAWIELSDLSRGTMQEIGSLEPFGSGNPEPVFYARSVEVRDARIVGDKHLKLKLRQGRRLFDGIGFGLAGKSDLGGKVVHMVFSPEFNEWQGCRRIQLRTIDLEEIDQGASRLMDSFETRSEWERNG